jgi:molybdopterin synthase sulfur carrier subunit
LEVARLTVQILYFSSLREQRGLSQESVLTSARTAGELYDELARAHGFRLPRSAVGVAVNLEATSFDAELNDGDVVVFLPPVAGG